MKQSPEKEAASTLELIVEILPDERASQYRDEGIDEYCALTLKIPDDERVDSNLGYGAAAGQMHALRLTFQRFLNAPRNRLEPLELHRQRTS